MWCLQPGGFGAGGGMARGDGGRGWAGGARYGTRCRVPCVCSARCSPGARCNARCSPGSRWRPGAWYNAQCSPGTRCNARCNARCSPRARCSAVPVPGAMRGAVPVPDAMPDAVPVPVAVPAPGTTPGAVPVPAPRSRPAARRRRRALPQHRAPVGSANHSAPSGAARARGVVPRAAGGRGKGRGQLIFGEIRSSPASVGYFRGGFGPFRRCSGPFPGCRRAGRSERAGTERRWMGPEQRWDGTGTGGEGRPGWEPDPGLGAGTRGERGPSA